MASFRTPSFFLCQLTGTFDYRYRRPLESSPPKPNRLSYRIIPVTTIGTQDYHPRTGPSPILRSPKEIT
jgi:hypothetical protein